MKKHYEEPVAELLVFNYQEQVVAASGKTGNGNGKGHAINSCYKHNTNDVYTGCIAGDTNDHD